MRSGFIAVSLSILVLYVAPSLGGQQDHATTNEQCSADMRLWRSQTADYFTADESGANAGTHNRSELMKYSVRQLTSRAIEMRKCVIVDPEKEDGYNQTASELDSAIKDRYVMFVVRHNLVRQFTLEDEAGKR